MEVLEVDEDGHPYFEDVDWKTLIREFKEGGKNGDGVVGGFKVSL